jgi:hypothetical protein
VYFSQHIAESKISSEIELIPLPLRIRLFSGVADHSRCKISQKGRLAFLIYNHDAAEIAGKGYAEVSMEPAFNVSGSQSPSTKNPNLFQRFLNLRRLLPKGREEHS